MPTQAQDEANAGRRQGLADTERLFMAAKRGELPVFTGFSIRSSRMGDGSPAAAVFFTADSGECVACALLESAGFKKLADAVDEAGADIFGRPKAEGADGRNRGRVVSDE